MYEVDNGVTLCSSHHEQVTGQEALFVVKFQAYIQRLKRQVEALQDLTGLT